MKFKIYIRDISDVGLCTFAIPQSQVKSLHVGEYVLVEVQE